MPVRVSGVYVIKNTANDKLYIGSTRDFVRRRNCHLVALRFGRHHNAHLQRAFLLLGENTFSFVMVEECEVSDLEAREQEWLDRYFLTGRLYNHFRTAYSVSGPLHPMFGHRHSEAAKEKIRLARSLQVVSHSAETRAKIGAGNKGRKANPECIRRMIAARCGMAPWNKGLRAAQHPSLSVDKVKFSVSQISEMLAAYLSGASINDLARRYGVTWSVVRRRLAAANVKTRSISEQKILRDQGREVRCARP